MTKPEAARYRTTNWKSCNDALRQRGSLLIWLDKDKTWLAIRARRPGRPPVFSDAAIQFCLIVKVLFGLPLRQCTGMVASILEMAGLHWPVPDFSTLSRRQKTLAVPISSRRAPGPLNLRGDSTGIRFPGDGEWLARRHGLQRRRQCRQRFIWQWIQARATSGRWSSPQAGKVTAVLPDLLDQIPSDEQIGTVTGDGAFATRLPCRDSGSRRCRRHPGPDERTPVEGRLPSRPPATASSGQANASVEPPGSIGPAITPEVGSRHECPRRFARTCGAEPARPQILRRADRLSRPRQANRRSPPPHRTHEPLQRTRHRRDQARGIRSVG